MSRSPRACRSPNWSHYSRCWVWLKGLIRNEATHEEAVKQLRSKANDLTERVVSVSQHVQTGLPCWGSELIPAEE